MKFAISCKMAQQSRVETAVFLQNRTPQSTNKMGIRMCYEAETQSKNTLPLILEDGEKSPLQAEWAGSDLNGERKI